MTGTNTIPAFDELYEVSSLMGSMHGHRLTASLPEGGQFVCDPVSVIEIDEDHASALARSIGSTSREMRRLNKQGRVLAVNDNSAIVLYFYDAAFFLTTLKA